MFLGIVIQLFINNELLVVEVHMEDFILRKYMEARKDCPDFSNGLDRFGPKTKWIVIVFFILMLVSYVWMFISLLLFQNVWFSIAGCVSLLISLGIVLIIDSVNKRKHLDRYINHQGTKIAILKDVLDKEFNISCKDKIMQLTMIYNGIIDEKIDDERKRSASLAAILSFLAGVLSISLNNSDKLGINYEVWLFLIIMVSLFVSLVFLLLFSFTFFDKQKNDYKMMVKDLKELLLLKY